MRGSDSVGLQIVTIAALAVLLVAAFPSPAAARRPACHLRNMALVGDAFCIDKFESVVQQKVGRQWREHSPFLSVRGKEIRAVARQGMVPQAYISRNEAAKACEGSGKRLCNDDEWIRACKGKRPTTFPYGDERRPGRCNDQGVSPLNHFFGQKDGPPAEAYGFGPMNDPRLNQLAGTVARAGRFSFCRNSYGLFDMVGNLHEWVNDPTGTFRGGYYLDTKINGDGCDYRTKAHAPSYHDYSTGFRCCAEPR